jgi:WD40 repeat protein/tRNA A-37 threonylcarbamoyl transferase component Bud32
MVPVQDEDRLQQVLAEYLEAADAGQPPDRAAYMARHPEFAGALAAFFANQDRVDELAAPLRAGPQEAATLAPQETPLCGTGFPASGEEQAPNPAGASPVRCFGDYELLEEIARGGMGVVYKARQVSLNRLVALKMILAGQLASATEVQRFRREAEAAAGLDHPHIVPIYEVGEHEGQQFFSMKLVEGRNLAQAIADLRLHVADLKTRPAFRTFQVPLVNLLVRVARAVHYAHQRGILHRDLKPANILLQNEKASANKSAICNPQSAIPLVTDFGLAKQVRQDKALTHSGSIVGTPSYMAPEQAKASKDLSTATDVYSLGAILYELLTGRPPFRADNPLDTLLQVMEREPDRPRALNARVDSELETICLKCLEKEPHKRYGSAEALAEDLERWLRCEPIQARSSTAWERTVKWVRRKPAPAALVAVSILAVLVLTGSGVGFTLHLDEALKQAEKERDDKDEARKQALKERDDKDEARKQALQERDAKDKALTRAEGLRLTFQAEVLRPVDPAQSLLLAVEGAKRHRSLLVNNALLASLDACLEERTFLGHRGEVLGASLSPDGKQVLTCSDDKTARLWDAANGQELVRLKHDDEEKVVHAGFSPDGRRVLTVASTRHLLTRNGQFSFSYGRLAVRTWEAASGKPLARWTEPGTVEEMYHRYRDESYAAAFSPDGKRVITAFSVYPGCPPRVHETETGKEVFVLDGHQGAAGTAAFSPDGRRIVTGSLDGSVCIWDAKSGKRMHTLRGDTLGVILALFSPDSRRVLTIGEGRTHSFEIQPNGKVRHDSQYHALKLQKGGVACGRVWDVESGKETAVLTWPKQDFGFSFGLVRTAAFSPDGKRIATGSNDRSRTGGFMFGSMSHASIWDAESGKQVVRFLAADTRFSQVNQVSFSPNGRWLLTAGQHQGTGLWDAGTGKERALFKGHKRRVYTAIFSDDGTQVVTASADGSARLWDARVDDETQPQKGIWRNMIPVLSPDGKRVAGMSHGYPNRLFTAIWDTRTGKHLVALKAQAGPGWFAEFSPDGTKLLTSVLAETAARLWNVADGKALATFGGHRGRVWFARLSCDSKRLVTISEQDNCDAFLWDVATGKRLFSFTDAITGGANAGLGRLEAAFSPDNRHLALVSEESRPGPIRWRLRVFDLATLKERWSFTQGEQAGTWRALVYNSTGDRLLTTNGWETCIRDAATGNVQLTISSTDETGMLGFAAFTPDDQAILTMGAGKDIHLWDARTGKLLKVFRGHEGQGSYAAFSPKGDLLVTVAEDNSARIWDVRSEKELLTLKPGRVRKADFTPDGRHVFTISEAGGRLWPVDPLPTALSRRPRALTEAELERFEIAERSP